MRQPHQAGEKLFVDYAGQGILVVNGHSGEVHEVAIFVAVLDASNSTYAEATWTQSLPDWIGSHVRTCAALGGVPEVVVPDHLKAAVTRAHRYEPEINRTYADLAQHYGFAVMPARAAKPRDKAKVEVGVQVVERWRLARLRHYTFFSRTEVNAALVPLLLALNARPFKKLPGSRQTLFDSLERPGAPTAAGAAICICRMETRPGQYRLPCGSRRPLLLRTLRAAQAATRCAAECPGGGTLPQGAPRGQPSALSPQGLSQHGHGAYAHGAPTLCGMDTPTADSLGGPQWSRDGVRGGNHSRLASSSPTRLSRLFRDHAVGQTLQR
jgi:hypothetical protein